MELLFSNLGLGIVGCWVSQASGGKVKRQQDPRNGEVLCLLRQSGVGYSIGSLSWAQHWQKLQGVEACRYLRGDEDHWGPPAYLFPSEEIPSGFELIPTEEWSSASRVFSTQSSLVFFASLSFCYLFVLLWSSLSNFTGI